MTTTEKISKEFIFKLLETVMDPEVPVISIIDLGIVRDVSFYPSPDGEGQGVRLTITPTYSGCPAMDVISMNIKMMLLENGIKNFEIKNVLSPAWTTDWMTENGKEKLKAYGITPPNSSQSACSPNAFQKEDAIQCPHCNSLNTTLISSFGSTACKALYKCEDCEEPFDYFKCH